MTSELLVEKRGSVRWITLNRPEKRNAINQALIESVRQAVAGAGDDPDLRAIVVTGAGEKAFCAGADLAPSGPGGAFDIDFSKPRHYVIDLFKQMEECPLPIIARVNGHALAGGFGLLCACDMAVSTDEARFGTPETKIGVAPMMILGYMMRVLPKRKLLEMCITGELIDAAEALEYGVVNYVVPPAELDAKTDWLIARIVSKSPTAVKLFRQGFHAMQDMDLRESFEYAQVMISVMANTQDAAEGRASFKEKRPAKWTGR